MRDSLKLTAFSPRFCPHSDDLSHPDWTSGTLCSCTRDIQSLAYLRRATDTTGNMQATRQLAERIAATGYESIPPEARTVAKQALTDFIGVAVAGAREPLAEILANRIAEDGGHPQAALIGRPDRASVRQAAWFNGSAGHAHDYDDVHLAMTGHPTVPVAPVVLALAEHRGRSGAEAVAAFCAGVDTECILGRYAGPGHYRAGWHATGTLGAFGATAAACALNGLDAAGTAAALGIAGTRAAGLKSQFGTMCKPLHAGEAAANGVEAADLAAGGFTSRPDILETDQGFMATQGPASDCRRFDQALQQPAYTQDICFKYHAACYLTHSSIEAARQLRDSNGFGLDDIAEVEIRVDPGHFKVCNIQEPATGLEAKFSLRFTAAMSLAGLETASIRAYTDDLTTDEQLVALRDRVQVRAHDRPTPDSIVTIRTVDGAEYTRACNVAIPMTDLDAQWHKLETKFEALVGPVLGANAAASLIDDCRRLDEIEDLTPLFNALQTES